MLSQIKYSDLPSYGLGMQQGILQGEATMLQNLLRLKFGNIPDSVTQRIQTADAQELLRWSERILSNNSLTEIFAEH